MSTTQSKPSAEDIQAHGGDAVFLEGILNTLRDPIFVKDEEYRWVLLNDAAVEMFGACREELIGKSDYDRFPKEQADVFWKVDELEGTCIFGSKAASRLTGHKLRELQGMNMRQLIAPEYVDMVSDRLTKRARGEPLEQPFTFDILHKDGRRITLELSTGGVLREGKLVGVQGVARDITQRKRAEEELRNAHDELEQRVQNRTAELRNANIQLLAEISQHQRAQERLRLLSSAVEQMSEGVAVADLNGSILLTNDAFARLHGYEKEELIGKHLSTFHPADEMPAVEAANRQIKETGEFNGEIDHKRRDGTVFLCVMHNTLLKDERGQAVGLIGTMRDITEEKDAEEALRVSEERFRALIENASDGLLVMSAKGELLYTSPSVERMLGHKATYLSGRGIVELVHDEDVGRIQREMASLIKDPTLLPRVQVRLRHCDGSWRVVEAVTSNLLDNPAVHGVVMNFRDITDHFEAEEALRNSEQQLRQAQKMEAIGRLAGGVAHDFNNLLTAILGFGRLAMDKLPEGHPARTDIDEVLHGGESATKLTQQLLAFGRKQIFQIQPIELNDVVLSVDHLLRQTLGEDIELVTMLGHDLGSVLVDPGSLEQVLVNLAVNARDAMPKGGKLFIQIERIRLGQEFCNTHVGAKPGAYLALSVRDTGCGMDENIREHAFEPFFTTKQKGQGTGLGLSTVYGIVNQCGGYVELVSGVEEGAEVRIYFPYVDSPAERLSISEEPTLPRGTEMVLVVEDEGAVRRLLVRILKSLGYRVLEAANGGEALLLCEETKDPIDLVLTDIVMPQIGGPDLVKRLRQVRSDFHVLFTTGFAPDTVRSRAGRDREAPILMKPYTRETLAFTVRSVLEAPPNETRDGA